MIPTKNRIIGLTAKIGSGKTFVAKLMKGVYNHVEVRAFGTKLKEVVKFAIGMDPGVKDNPEYDNVTVDEYYVKFDDPIKKICERLDMLLNSQRLGQLTMGEMTMFADVYTNSKSAREFHRVMLQKVGTEIFRKRDKDYWVKVFAADVLPLLNDRWTLLVIDDVRFPNEADFIKNLDGKIVKIEPVNQKDVNVVKGVKGHDSETLISRIEPDMVLENDFAYVDKTLDNIEALRKKLEGKV